MKIRVLPVWRETQTPIDTCEHEATMDLLNESPAAIAAAVGGSVLETFSIVRLGFNEVLLGELEFRVSVVSEG